MGLRRLRTKISANLRASTRTETLERRLCLAIESVSTATSIDPDTDLLSQSAAISAAADGTSVVAYADRDGVSGKGNDIWVRKYLLNGVATGLPMRVNTTLTGAQMNVDVSMYDADNYAVVWQSENQDGSGWGIYGRIHNISGWTNEFLVNETTAGNQVAPKVAMTPGGAVVTWVARDDNGGNGEIYAREISLAGTTPEGEVKLTTGGNFAVTVPDVAYNGSFGFTWVSSDIANAGQTDVKFIKYDSTLDNAQGTIQTVNTITNGDQAEPAITALGGRSEFLIAFSDTSSGGDAEIAIRLMTSNAGGASTPAQQLASQDSDGNRTRPVVSANTGTIIVGWTQQVAGASFGSSVTRAYDRNVSPTSNETPITDGESVRTLHGVAVTGAGRFREVTSQGLFQGYGFASVASAASVLRINGTPGNDNIVADDIDGATVRVSINGQTASYARESYDHLRFELGDGDDQLTATDTNFWATVSGGNGNDFILGTSAADSISGGDGDDLIVSGPGSDYAIGNGGNDRLMGDDGDDTLTGGAGKDTMHGGFGIDRLAGSGSPDILQGEGGDDRLYGEAGDDRVDGGGGRDRVYGGDGNDLLVGGSSNDRLYGDIGNDSLNGGTGNDYLDGWSGIDIAIKRETGDTLINIE